MTDSSAPEADRRGLAEPLVLSLVVGALAAVMFATHRNGHWWGDDWALYLRQADSLVHGDPGRVLAENEFTVTASRGPAFSPPLYPWGFPLVLAPFVAAWGTDIDRLAVVPVLAACAFACAWYLLARRRVGVLPAMVGVVAITITPTLVGWTELIQSEWVFLAVTAWALVVLDGAVASDRLIGAGTRWWTLVAIGLWAAAAFSVRREGLAMGAAIGTAQLAALLARRRDGVRPFVDRRLLARLAVPHAVGGIAVLLLQVTLPTTVIPQYSGTSVLNAWRLRSEHVDHLLEIVGLKRPWEAEPTVFGNAVLGWTAAVVFLVVAVAGLVRALTRRHDAHLAVYALAAFTIGASFRVAVNRYLATVGPILLVLAMAVVAGVLGRSRRRWAPLVATTVAVAAIAAGNVANVHLRIDRAADAARDRAVEWGPTHPLAIAMFAEVVERSDPDDVVAGPKARALTFATGRLAVQVDDHRPLPAIDLAVVVTEPGTKIQRRMLSDPRFDRVWWNSRFTIFVPLDPAE